MRTFGQDIAKTAKNVPNQLHKTMDNSIFIIVFMLTCFGLIMIWSASMYNAKLEGDEFLYVMSQLKYAVIGFTLMWCVSLIDYRFVKKYATLIMGVIVVMLLIVAAAGVTVNGAGRWLSLGNYVVQPSEFAKIAVIIFLAAFIERRYDLIKEFKSFFMLLVFCGVIGALIAFQPALSTAVVVVALSIAMYFLAGGKLVYITGMVTILGIGIYFFIVSTAFRMNRIFAYLDPWEHLLQTGWQPAQSLMALGSGGIFGVGVGNGRAKLMFLPEPQNDYIFAIIGEELGLIGCTILIIAYGVLIYKLVQLSFAAPDVFSRMLVAGMAVLLSMQVFINVAVVTNMIPSTGITLPFISSGGSSLISMLLCMGVVLNISRNKKRPKSTT